jgi:2-polyprenyl-3-methyl-5-hydroxy-6-metoxy-1,4-benzoquinol methylase
MNKIQNCLLCKNSNLEILKNYQKDYLVQCPECSFVFSNQAPSQEELDKVYSNYSRNHGHLTLISQEKIQKRAQTLMNLKPLQTVLDIGCGDGHFLSSFQKLGVKTFGTEFDEFSASTAKKNGAIILDGGLMPEIPNDLQGFDAIIFTEVIEHINNPETVLNHFYKILSPGGLIFMTTPNFASIERYALGPEWGMICYPEHISYYTPRTLNQAFKKIGFKKISVYTENISVFRISQYYKNKNNKISKQNQMVKKIDPENISVIAQQFANQNAIGVILKSAINALLRVTGSGSSLVGIYQKPFE